MFTQQIQVSTHELSGDRFIQNADLSQYPDGMPNIIRPNPVLKVNSLTLRPKTMDAFIAGMMLADAYAERGNRIKRLVLPCVPGGRQDRFNDNGDVLFTLKFIAKMINAQKFDDVVILDPHSTVTTALIDRVKVYPLPEVFRNSSRNFDAVIAPDVGAVRRAEQVADTLGLPVIQAQKKRDVATGKLSGFDVTVNKGKYLVVDDLCDGGGTFIGLGNKIKEQGATANLYVTHGLFTKGTEELLKLYGNIATTDSTLFNRPNVKTINVVEGMKTWML